MLRMDEGRRYDIANLEAEIAKPTISQARRDDLIRRKENILRQMKDPWLFDKRTRMAKALKAGDGATAEKIGHEISRREMA